LFGNNNGTLHGGASFTNGEAGQAFQFDGSTGYVTVPASSSLNVGTNVGLTVECWINPASLAITPSAGPVIVDWNTGNTIGVQLGIFGNPNSFFANVLDTSGNQHGLNAPANILHTNVFQHLAATYDKASGVAKLYFNGALAASNTLGSFTPQTACNFNIGAVFGPNPVYFQGAIDEVSVYGRALSATEIAAIYNATSAGKCPVPALASQPASQVDYWGSTLTLTANAKGANPLTYQWDFDGVAIAGATNASLVLSNVAFGNAGDYTVVVSNMYGVVRSAPAIVTVNPAGVSIALYPGITIDGVVGLTYGIQYTTNLNNTNDWFGLANVTLGTTNELWFDVQAATQPRRFYRVIPGPITIP